MEVLSVSVKKTITTKGGTVFNVDEKVICKPENNFLIISNGDKKCRLPYSKAYLYLTKFKKEPSLNSLEKQALSGITTTPIGNKVETDGNDVYGFPSWLIINGII